jgi:hypothetical protein
MEILEGLATMAAVFVIIVMVISFALKYLLPIILGIGAILLVIDLISKANKEKQERLEKAEEERRLKET